MQGILTQYLTIDDPGPHRPALRALATFRLKGRRPDHRSHIRFYHNTPARIILPRGLVYAARTLGDFPIIDRRLRLPPVDFGWTGTLRPEQQQAVDMVCEYGDATLIAPTSAGKTIMGLAIVARRQQPTLWIVDKLELAAQALTQLRALTRLPRWAFGLIGDGRDDSTNYRARFLAATVQTLVARPDILQRLIPRIGMVVVDEAHHVPAETFSQVIHQFPAVHRLGLSATPDRTDGLGPMVTALMGPKIQIPYTMMVDLGRLMVPRVVRVATSLTTDESTWAAIQRARANDPTRNAQVLHHTHELFQAGRYPLVLVDLTIHAKALAAQLVRRGVPALAVTGAMSAHVRKRAFERVQRHEVVLVATKLADEGLDLPRLDCLALAAPGRSQPRLEQQMGRLMRVAPHKPTPVLYDFWDPGVPALAKQATARMKVYRNRDLEVVDR